MYIQHNVSGEKILCEEKEKPVVTLDYACANIVIFIVSILFRGSIVRS